MAQIDGELVLRVELLPDPCLWYWEIRDAVDGRVVESSWATDWMAYTSRTEATAAGARRLAERAAAGVPAAGPPAAGSGVGETTSSRRPGRRMTAERQRRAG